uniref:(northern house mosquito) hypothetical protein n=1 Tax=Culex pipiens TaxID=7175 RepID=A0A8D8CFA4_CULPI
MLVTQLPKCFILCFFAISGNNFLQVKFNKKAVFILFLVSYTNQHQTNLSASKKNHTPLTLNKTLRTKLVSRQTFPTTPHSDIDVGVRKLNLSLSRSVLPKNRRKEEN